MYTKIKPNGSAYIYYLRPEVYRRIYREQKHSLKPINEFYMDGADFVVDWYNNKLVKSIVDVESIVDKWTDSKK